MTDTNSSGGWWDAPPITDVIPNQRIWWRRLTRTVALVAALHRVWWPIWLPALGLILVGVGFWSTVAATAIITGGAGLISTRARTWLQNLPAATVRAVFRWRWPTTCSLACLAVAIHGAVRHPRLIDVELHSERWWWPWQIDRARLVLEPLPIQEPDKWPLIAGRLGRRLGFAVATPQPMDTLLTVHLRRTNLPDRVVVGEDVPFEAILPDADHIDFGDSALGEPIRWALNDPTRPHALVAGGTGGGKGNAARTALCGGWLMLHRGLPALVVVANPKATGEFTWCQGWAAVASTTPGICLAISWVYQAMERRAKVCLEAGVDHFCDLPADQQARLGGRMLFIFDEWSDFITDPFLPNPKQIMGMATSLSRKARALGINLMVNGQHVTGEMFSPGSTGGAGTAFIANMTARIAIGSIEPSGARTLFGSEGVAAVANGDIAGRAYTRGLGLRPHGQDAIAGQLWFIPRALVEALGPPTDEVATPPDFDQLAAELAAAEPDTTTTKGGTRSSRKKAA